jgi:hypothetical protein
VAGRGGQAAAGGRVQSARPSSYYHSGAGGGVGASPAGGVNRGQQQEGVVRQLAPHELDTLELAPVLARLEEDMRGALRARSALHVPERVVLLRALGKVRGTQVE